MCIVDLLLLAVLGCTSQPEATASPVVLVPVATPTSTTPTVARPAAEPASGVSVSVKLGEDGGSLETSGDHVSTSIELHPDGTKVDVDAKKNKN